MGENKDRKFRISADFHGTLRDLLHAANLRHRTQGFTYLPKKGVLRIFPSTASAGFEPANLSTRGQHANPIGRLQKWYMKIWTEFNRHKRGFNVNIIPEPMVRYPLDIYGQIRNWRLFKQCQFSKAHHGKVRKSRTVCVTAGCYRAICSLMWWTPHTSRTSTGVRCVCLKTEPLLDVSVVSEFYTPQVSHFLTSKYVSKVNCSYFTCRL
jgi:hypothetical protein